MAYRARDPAHRRGVQAELVPVTPDQAGPEAGPDQHRPQIPRVVVRLVVVHLLGRAEPEPERRELQERLAEPRRDVEDAPRRRERGSGGNRRAPSLARTDARAPTGTARRRATRPRSSAARRAASPRWRSRFGCRLRSSASARSTSMRRAHDVELGPRERAPRSRSRSRPSRRARESARRRAARCAEPDAEAVDRRRRDGAGRTRRGRSRNGQRLTTIPWPLRLWMTSRSGSTRCSSTNFVTPGAGREAVVVEDDDAAGRQPRPHPVEHVLGRLVDVDVDVAQPERVRRRSRSPVSSGKIALQELDVGQPEPRDQRLRRSRRDVSSCLPSR